jgi:tetratricopeptide (TPR) repeat protein
MTEEERKKFYSDLDVVYESGGRCSVEAFLTERAAVYSRENNGVNDAYLSCLSELGSFYRGASRYEEALEMFRRADAIIVPVFGEFSLEHSVNVNNMAGTYRMMGEADKALELFLEALRVCEALPEKNDYVYASALNNTSLLYQLKKEYEKAICYARSSIGELEKVPGAKNELATAYANLSLQLSSRGEKDEALTMLEKSIELFRSLGDRSDHYAAALNGKGVLSAERGNIPDAKEAFREALSIIEEGAGENADCGITCRNMARTLAKNGEYQEALPYIRRAAGIFNRIFEREHPLAKSASEELSEMENLLSML